jgi:ABC-2 type transport system ATP-binding protein
MIEVQGVSKSFGSIEALRAVDLHIPRGVFYGLLGPNGAGKSTLMNVLAGIVMADAGTVRIGGHLVGGHRTLSRLELGLVPQSIALYPSLDALENLHVFGRLYGLRGWEIRERGERLLHAVGLWERRTGKVRDFSGGMKRRLNIVASLLHQPRFLLCDEPTVGVDPQSRNAIFDFLEAQRGSGLTILYTTHYMEEAERLCDRIAIIDHGRIIAEGTRDELLSRLDDRPLLRLKRSEASARIVEATLETGYVWADEESGYIATLPTDAKLSDLYQLLEHNDLDYRSLEMRSPTIENLFLHLTGRSLRE